MPLKSKPVSPKKASSASKKGSNARNRSSSIPTSLMKAQQRRPSSTKHALTPKSKPVSALKLNENPLITPPKSKKQKRSRGASIGTINSPSFKHANKKQKSALIKTPNSTSKLHKKIHSIDIKSLSDLSKSGSNLIKKRSGHKFKSKENSVKQNRGRAKSFCHMTEKEKTKNVLKNRSNRKQLNLDKLESKHNEIEEKSPKKEINLTTINMTEAVTAKKTLKKLFKTFQQTLKDQETYLLNEIDKNNVDDGVFRRLSMGGKISLQPISSERDLITPVNKPKLIKKKNGTSNKKVIKKEIKNLFIDDNKVVSFIQNIGNIKMKSFEEVLQDQEQTIAKLREIIDKQNSMKKDQEKVIELRKESENDVKYSKSKKKEVEKELEAVKPLIEKAKIEVSKIKKSDIDELRHLIKPPKIVKKVINCMVYVLYDKKAAKDCDKNNDHWQNVRKLLTYKFIADLLNFDTKTKLLLNMDKMKYVNKRYVNDEEFTYERAMIASKVAGPVVHWLKSQMKFATVLTSVKPLLDEIDECEKRMNESKQFIERFKVLEIKNKKDIKKCQHQMITMIGYNKIGNKYFMQGN